MISNKNRNATVVAASEIILAVLNQGPFNIILKKHTKKMLDQNVAMMTNFSIIEQFSKAYKEKILKYAKEFTLYKDQYLFKENEDPEYVYFLVEGTITLQKEFWVSESLICRY